MSFLLFLFVNAVLFIRPGEIVEELAGAPIYQTAILLCLASALPELATVLFGESLERQPITFCVLGLFGAVILAHVTQAQLDRAFEEAQHFGKIVVYYLLLIATVNTPRRLRWFLGCVVIFAMAVCILGILQYHGEIRLASYKPSVKENVVDPTTGQTMQIERLQGAGIFQDPNDLCIVIASLVPIVLFRMSDGGLARLVWLGPLGVFGYTIYLTYSRGGLLALLSGLAFWAIFRFGGKRALVLMLLGIPLLLVVFAGRQTNLSANAGSAQTRIGLWSDWFQEFRANPLFGKGPECAPVATGLAKDAFAHKEHLAHNAFLQSFADLGILGGVLFVGAFFFAFEALARYGFGGTKILYPESERLHPYLLGSLAAYMVGMLALSIGYITSTYIWLGLATVFVRITPCFPPIPRLLIDRRLLQRWAVAGMSFLVAIYVAVRLFRSY